MRGLRRRSEPFPSGDLLVSSGIPPTCIGWFLAFHVAFSASALPHSGDRAMVKVVTAETSEEGSTEHMSSSSECVLLEGHVEYMFLT